MANLRNITNLPMAESADGLNLIVNENGSAKQIAASAVGVGGVFVIDITSDDFSDSDITYGNTIKEALLNGKTVYFYDGTFHIVTSGFRIIESTTGDAFLQVYRNLTPTNGSLGPNVTFMTFPITV